MIEIDVKIAYMRTSSSVEDWNEKRQQCIDDFTDEMSKEFDVDVRKQIENDYNKFLNTVDASGLIVEVLGQDDSGIIHRQRHPEAYQL